MTVDVVLTLCILAGSIALFVSERLRLDVVALLVLLSLVLTGVLPFNDAVAGFSNPVVLMITGLFVIGAGLTETGVADWLGGRLARFAGRGEGSLIVTVMIATSLLSAFMSSTGTVAILLPVVGTLAQRRGIALSKVFLPLAFAAHLGSLLTLIATPPNLVVSDALREAGREPFRFFSFTPIGITILVVGLGFFLLIGRRLLPAGEGGVLAPVQPLLDEEFVQDYGIGATLHTLVVREGSRLVGKTLGEANLRASHHVNVVGISTPSPSGPVARAVVPKMAFGTGDVLRVQGPDEAVAAVAAEWELEEIADRRALALPADESLVEVVLTRRSTLVGKTLKEARFRDRYRSTVLAVRRGAKEILVGAATPALREEPLQPGDMLLLKGRRKHLRNLRDERRDFLIVAAPDMPVPDRLQPGPALVALGITLAMLIVMAFGWLPNALTVLLAAVAMVLTNCVRPADAYRAVNWESVVLIAGMLPLATALDTTGATKMLVAAMERTFSGASPYVILSALMAATAALGLVVSNTATAVLVAPVAVRMAAALDLAPEPLLMGVAIAASAAFATPIASPVNTLVVGPGGYRFADFVKVGLPLTILVLVAGALVVPLFFPF